MRSLTMLGRIEVVKVKGKPQRKAKVPRSKKGGATASRVEVVVEGGSGSAPSPSKKPETDDEKKARKNAYVRAWRAAHKDEYAAYMKEWREKKGKGPDSKRKATSKAESATRKAEAKPSAEPGSFGAVGAATA